jgi:hypothetical protein
MTLGRVLGKNALSRKVLLIKLGHLEKGFTQRPWAPESKNVKHVTV